MKIKSLLVLFAIFLIYPLGTFAQTDFPVITMPRKYVPPGQLQLFNNSTNSAVTGIITPKMEKVQNMMDLLNAAYFRINNIGERISTRIVKTQYIQTPANKQQLEKIKSLYETLNKQLVELKNDILKTADYSQNLFNNTDGQNNYINYRDHVYRNLILMKDILVQETSLTSSLKAVSTPSGEIYDK